MNCFEVHKIEGLEDEFKKRLKPGMSDHEARMVGIGLAKEYHALLHSEMEGLKKQVNPKYAPTKLKVSDNSNKIATLHAEYDAKINDLKKQGEPSQIGITHSQMDELAKKYGFDTYEESPERVSDWDEQAAKKLAENPDSIKTLVNKMRDGGQPDKVEQRMILQYVADLEAKIQKDPTPERLTQLKRIKDLSNIVGGREVAKSLRARQDSRPAVETLPDFYIQEMEAAKSDRLTESEKAQAEKDFNEQSAAKNARDEKIAALEVENVKLKAAKAVKSISGKKAKKTSEQYAKERADIVEAMRKDLLKVAKGGGGAMSSVPGAAQLAAVAPHVAKLVKNIVEQGIDKLEDVVKNVHDILKDHIEGISENDVTRIISGEFDQKKESKTSVLAKVRDLKTQARLTNELSDLMFGNKKPKTEKQKRERNRRITELENSIKDWHKLVDEEKEKPSVEKISAEERVLNQLKNRYDAESEKLKAKIEDGDFGPEEKKVPLLQDPELKKSNPKLVEEAAKARDTYEKLKEEREIRLIKKEAEARGSVKKGFDQAARILNTPRELMSSADFSAAGRQAAVATVAHPRIALKAAKKMFANWYKTENFDRFFNEIKESPDYEVMTKSKLALTDPHDPILNAHEEAFGGSLAKKIPIIGTIVDKSDRAYVTYLNAMRVEVFREGVQKLKDAGMTFENAEKEYKALAEWVNVSTGRAAIGDTLEKAAPLLNAAFFSPRLIAARLKALNPVYYAKLPKAVRVMALRDMAAFIATNAALAAMAKYSGLADVELDPRSSDFGKLKVGNTRYDIWGGFQQYVRVFTQILSGQKKSTGTGAIKELNGSGAFGETKADVAQRFVRGKLAPVPSMVWDFLADRTVTGEKVNMKDEAIQHFLPLIYSDVKDAMDDQGIKALFTVGLPSVFGVGVQTFKKTSTAKPRKNPPTPKNPKE